MEKFKNLEELWDYCSFCPICQTDSQIINIYVSDFKSGTYAQSITKNRETLEFVYESPNREKKINCIIDCSTNYFISGSIFKLNGFVISSICKNDEHQHILFSKLVFFNHRTERLDGPFVIDTEEFSYSTNNNNDVSIYYDYEYQSTSIIIRDNLNNSSDLELDYILKLDYTAQPEIIYNKIKTLMVFQ